MCTNLLAPSGATAQVEIPPLPLPCRQRGPDPATVTAAKRALERKYPFSEAQINKLQLRLCGGRELIIRLEARESLRSCLFLFEGMPLPRC